MRYRDEPPTVGVDLSEDGNRYHVERVEPPPNGMRSGTRW